MHINILRSSHIYYYPLLEDHVFFWLNSNIPIPIFILFILDLFIPYISHWFDQTTILLTFVSINWLRLPITLGHFLKGRDVRIKENSNKSAKVLLRHNHCRRRSCRHKPDRHNTYLLFDDVLMATKTHIWILRYALIWLF